MPTSTASSSPFATVYSQTTAAAPTPSKATAQHGTSQHAAPHHTSPFFSLVEKILAVAGKVVVVGLACLGALSVLLVGSLAALIINVSNSGGVEQSEIKIHEQVVKKGGDEKIVIIPIHGEIVSGTTDSDPWQSSSAAMSETVLNQLDQAQHEPSIKAIVLDINTPGGSVVASDVIYRKVREVRTKKPVIAVMTEVAASGGYYISAGASKIIAHPATLTGSIGVIAHFPKLSDLYEKIGYQERVVKSGLFKDIGSASRDMTPEEQQIIGRLIDEAYDQFVFAIHDGRNMDEARVRTMADGRIYSGEQAQTLGLVDELGSLDDGIDSAMSLAKVTNPTLVKYKAGGFFDNLFSSSAAMPLLTSLTGLESLNKAAAYVPEKRSGLYYLYE